LLSCSISGAQQSEAYHGGSGHFFMGNTWMDFGSINPYLKRNGFHKLQNSVLTTGGSGFGVFNNFIVGGEGSVFAANATQSVAGKVSLAGGYGMVHFGYMLPIKSRFLFYPITGMGWGASNLNIENASGIKDRYNNSTFYLKTEFNIDLYANTQNNILVKKGFKTGLSVGYLFNPQSSAWTHENGGSAEFNNTFFNGFYLKLKFGGGGFEMK
jgi:hypothetical protein